MEYPFIGHELILRNCDILRTASNNDIWLISMPVTTFDIPEKMLTFIDNLIKSGKARNRREIGVRALDIFVKLQAQKPLDIEGSKTTTRMPTDRNGCMNSVGPMGFEPTIRGTNDNFPEGIRPLDIEGSKIQFRVVIPVRR